MSEFDENDRDTMEGVSLVLVDLVPLIFPDTIALDGTIFMRTCKPEHEMQFFMIGQLIKIIEECMGDLYVKHKGENWREEKVDELTEPGLVMLWYADGTDICGFLAFKLAQELYGKTLYLYEIQVLPRYQGKGIGSRLMHFFHQFARFVNDSTFNTSINYHRLLSTGATSLTVFSDNARALTWYTSHGYVPSVDCPADRQLRDGKVIKPSFYLLTRPVHYNE